MKKSLFYFAICVLSYACSDFNDIENVKEDIQIVSLLAVILGEEETIFIDLRITENMT